MALTIMCPRANTSAFPSISAMPLVGFRPAFIRHAFIARNWSFTVEDGKLYLEAVGRNLAWRELHVGGSLERNWTTDRGRHRTLQLREQTDEKHLRIFQSRLFGATDEDFHFDERQDYSGREIRRLVLFARTHTSGIKKR